MHTNYVLFTHIMCIYIYIYRERERDVYIHNVYTDNHKYST